VVNIGVRYFLLLGHWSLVTCSQSSDSGTQGALRRISPPNSWLSPVWSLVLTGCSVKIGGAGGSSLSISARARSTSASNLGPKVR
jgi:hypothetical protein